MKRTDEIWKTEEISKTFLEGVRGAIPLAAEQIDVMLRMIKIAQPNVKSFLDLGCGDGVLGRAIHRQYPEAKGVFLDFSESMLQAARRNLEKNSGKLDFIVQDLGDKQWIDSLESKIPFDVIVSGFAIHHQPDERKKEIYKEIYQLLTPGGVFLNLEHVSSESQWSEMTFNELFIDSLYSFHKSKFSAKSREEIAQEYYHRPDKAANILAPLETQCNWLRELGFVDVDCFIKVFELALFGGRRPSEVLELA